MPGFRFRWTSCFARRGTDWTTRTPLAITSTFYADARLNRLWGHYRTSTNPLVLRPDAFDVVGERILAKVYEAIERLKERRVALISAAATGKIDVRDAA